MPYAPGEHYAAGDYFAAVGPRIAQNIQTWQQNRQEHDQAIASAEMIGRYMKDDPQFHEMFGEQFGKAPGMSTGALKGMIGSAAMYMTQQRLKAEQQDQAARTELLKQEQGLRAAEAAQRLEAQQRLGTFNRYVGQQLNPPMSYKPGSEPPMYRPPLDADTFIRYAGQAGVITDPGVAAVINAIQNSQRGDAKPQPFTAGSLSGVYSPRSGEFKIGEPTGPTAFPVAQIICDEEGNVVGKGFVSPKGGVQMLPKETTDKLDERDQTFLGAASQYPGLLDKFDKEVEKLGTFDLPSEQVPATLKQLAFDLVTARSKLVDPGSHVTQGEVDTALANLFPYGRFVPLKTTKAAIESQRDVAASLIKNWSDTHGGRMPPNLPKWVHERIAARSDAPSTTVAVISPDGRRGNMPKDKIAEALKNGFKLAE